MPELEPETTITTKPSWLNRLKEPKIYIPTALLICIIAVGASSLYRYFVAGKSSQTPTIKAGILPFGKKDAVAKEKTVVSPLDGLYYPESVANRHALGVMIENHPDSRPQFGLSDASIVYEAQAEGGITRFLAIFGPKLPEKVGPVRSARTYYAHWCAEYSCDYAHVGGNIDALDLIPKLTINDLDQFRYGVSKYDSAYYRIARKGIATEHTMYANPEKLYKIAQSNGWPMADGFPAINFKEEAATANRPTSQKIAVDISSKQFNVVWDYDPATNSYTRAMAGTTHVDGKTSQPIKSKVVIVQEVKSQPTVTRINEQGLILDTVGTGKATIIQDGKAVIGTWKKSSLKDRTIFMDDQGREISYNPGQRWIMAVNPGTAVTITSPTATPTP